MATNGSSDGDFGLQIAPMLDVMFVLLLFFMISAGSVLKETELGVNVGKGESEGPSFLLIQIDISKEGLVRYNKAVMDTSEDKELPSLRERLKTVVELDPRQSVVIRPEGAVEHERLVDVLNACSWAHVSQLSFAGGN